MVLSYSERSDLSEAPPGAQARPARFSPFRKRIGT
jgi:hypothetical protein